MGVAFFSTFPLLHLHVVSALAVHITQLPDSLQVSNLTHCVVALLEREAFVKPLSINKLFQLLTFAPCSLLGCHRRPLPWLAFLPLLCPSTSTTSTQPTLTLTLTLFNDVPKELFFLIREGQSESGLGASGASAGTAH